MRTVLYILTTFSVIGLAFWAYRENYRTQAAIDDMGKIRREIAGLREDLGVLRAEWAYQNRPERLRQLVDLNFERLLLVPQEMGQVVELGHVDYPKPAAPVEEPNVDPASEEQKP